MGYIYTVTNKINNKKYVGQTIQKDIKSRWYSHKNLKHRTVGQKLLNAYKKYGIENFEYKLICICFDEDTNKYEAEYIKYYNCLHPNGYNLLEGGNNRKHNECTKKLISQKLTGDKNPNFGIKKTPEEIQKMSERMKGCNNPNYGKKLTPIEKQKRLDRYLLKPEIKIKISNSLRDYYKNNINVPAYTKSNYKKVEQYDLDGNLICIYNSISQASRSVNISHSVISRACNKDKFVEGYKWRKYNS